MPGLWHMEVVMKPFLPARDFQTQQAVVAVLLANTRSENSIEENMGSRSGYTGLMIAIPMRTKELS